ncbi:MAG: LysE family translocator [Nitratireductor sp.]|nr:LysE family translocator [Nitratireductor sp.]MCB1456293.1 LysE family translocator [Nitratireductor sp.]
MSAEFLITSMIVVLLPGAGVLYTLATGLGLGARASLLAAFGCTIGILPHMLASIFGLAALLHASASAFNAIKYAGVVYLLYLAWGMLKEGGTLSVKPDRQARSASRIIFDAIAINSLNPKLSIFFLAFLPQFIPVGFEEPARLMLGLGLIFMAMTFVVFVLYGLLATAMRAHVISRPRLVAWIQKSFAATFGLLAFRLAFSER